ncbi:MAG TPA: acetate--CoA ligase, partial [Thermoanaerobaculia bacterium]|nr:acetate--CoA ligase [Thermoanaerobaculia bacterium]
MQQRIAKSPLSLRAAPNLGDYDRVRASFTWGAARRELDGLPGGAGLNIAHEAVTRHAAGPRAGHVALRCVGKKGEVRDIAFAELEGLTNRFANILAGLGVEPGERVFALLPRVPELYVTALGTLKTRAVFSPLFPAFGPEPIRQRLTLGDGRVLVTTAALYRKKVAELRRDLPGLEAVLLIGRDEDVPCTRDFHALLEAASDRFTIPPTSPDDMALLHFTSGTTGRPKGAVHVHGAVVAHHATGGFVLDFHPDDVFWCTADPGWVTGTSYGIVSPLTHGVTSIVDEGDFDAERWYGILEDQKVTIWYTAPTAVRVLMKVGAEMPKRFDLSALRHVASVGEPLNPEAVVWGVEALGLPIHDNWWQTETGAIMIANFPGMDIKPGSMGRPVPGVEAGVVRRTAGGGVEEVGDAATTGELALRPGWPSMFRDYLGEEERYRKCFADGWYLTGDLARRDEEGYYWFVGRSDDVIKSSGHLIGPFEVESVLMEHPAVAEAGVIGKPDPVAGEIVKAFVSLKHGFTTGEELRRDLLAHARRRLGAAVAPKEIAFLEELPRTRSGKIMRRLLKA